MNRRNLNARDLELLTELIERELLDDFLSNAEQRLFQNFKAGDVETRRHTGYALDALAVLGVEIKASISEAIRNGRSDATNDGKRAA